MKKGIRFVLVFGVSGSGKSTLANALAQELEYEFIEADALHSQENIEKMKHGKPLTDSDRKPWLERVRQESSKKKCVVIACSALKKSYRDFITSSNSERWCLVFLKGSFDVIESRMKKREHHFMREGMLQSQFDCLEEPNNEEDVIICDVESSTEDQVKRVLQHL